MVRYFKGTLIDPSVAEKSSTLSETKSSNFIGVTGYVAVKKKETRNQF